jgi:ferritin-like metal-binding protein YciE
MNLNTMDSLFEHDVHDLYSAEKQILEALPEMISAASSQDLRSAFQRHLAVTERQLERLQGAMHVLEIKPNGVVCKGMKGLLDEGKEIIEAEGDPSVKDAALIGAAQRVEHYEIAAYGTARAFARELGFADIARSLDMTLQEEGGPTKN